MGSQEQPWALEQHGGQPAVQSRGFTFFTCPYIIHSSDGFKSCFMISVTWSVGHFKLEAYVWGMQHVSSVILRQSPQLLPHTGCVLLCVCFSSLQLTWTTPSWRRTGLIFKSTCHRSAAYGAFALFCQIQTYYAEWIMNHTPVHSFSLLFSSVVGGILALSMIKWATICLPTDEFIFDCIVNY